MTDVMSPNGSVSPDTDDDKHQKVQLTKNQTDRLLMYVERIKQAQALLEDALINIMIGRDVDMTKTNVRLLADCTTVILSPMTGANEGEVA